MEPISMLMFAGVTALASASSAYSAYRANHPRPNRTGQITNYTAAHAGYSMAAPSRPVPQYNYLIHAPVYNVNYNQVTYVNPPVRSQSYIVGPSQQQRPQPNSTGRSQSYNSGRPSQQLVPRSQPNSTGRSQSYNSGRPSQQQLVPRSQPDRSVSQQTQPAGFGGTISLIVEQQAPDTYEDDTFGLSTGSRYGYTKTNARNHWQSFQRRNGYCGESRTVAVINWTTATVTMFVERDMTYFRNYLVIGSDVDGFARKYRGNQKFSGIVKDGELVGSNHPSTIVEDDGDCEFDSSNCWTQLGIPKRGVPEPVFVEMVRGAVFGLICCVPRRPSMMNVDMLYGDDLDFVHVDGEQDYLETGPDCCFSVFSFLTEGWASDLVLVG